MNWWERPLKWWAKLFFTITGGRPMVLLIGERYAPFRDVVSGNIVWYWRDRFGNRWMAESAWSSFRVEVTNP